MNKMKTKLFMALGFTALVLGVCTTTAQEIELKVDIANSVAKIQPTMYGIFFEDINFAADGGLYAEMVKNRSFEFLDPKMGWIEPNTTMLSFNKESGLTSILKYSGETTNHNYCRVKVNNDQSYVLINEGFKGMGIKNGEQYNLILRAAKQEGDIKQIIVSFIDSTGVTLGKTTIAPTSMDWNKYKAQIVATKTEAKAKLKITFIGTGSIDLDMISVFPKNTWKGRKNGLRADLVQLLYDMDPGFLRFPGGCIVEGRTLAQRYQWKKTIGPFGDRELLINRWNNEFDHRPAPDYFQTFGLGFYEYFQLSEDIGAEPLPILGCGMACQFNTGELVPLEDLDPYVQDALDLIEFANGNVSTAWGKIRQEMGHPEPFHMKYIGIGNEQWGPEYIERYKIFEKAIKAKYPEIIIVSGSGPGSEGEYFDYGMRELKKLNSELIDEHYYKGPEWFRQNAARYDNYDRKGPKIFAGEYAAQSVAVVSPDNKNNWECAMSEAAFMTGLERNAEVVHLTSYAPLMAHAEGWQWTPDMIWFNNLESYGTPNYYVQKMYGTHRGTDVLTIHENGKPLTGQRDLYASAARDDKSNEVLVKLVNTSDKDQILNIDFKGQKMANTGEGLVLRSDNLEEVNSFEFPKKLSPKPSEILIKKNKTKVLLPAYTFMIIKGKTK